MSVAATIQKKLEDALHPQHLEIRNDSDKHKGHAGHDGGGESHFHVQVVSASFEGLSRMDRQRLVYAALEQEMSGQIHALSIKALSPSEYSQ